MNSSFHKQMLVTAIAAVLSAPAWATEAQAGKFYTGNSTDTSSTSQPSTTYGSTSGASGSTSHMMGSGNSRADNPLYRHSVNNLLGADIVGASGEEIGEIEHVVLTRDRRSAHAIVSVGGFLGIGDHDIAVSLDELQPAGNNSWRLSATKEQLEARPAYQSNQYLELEGDRPISGSITDFAAFETDQNRPLDTVLDIQDVKQQRGTTGYREADKRPLDTALDTSAARPTDGMTDKNRSLRQSTTGSGAAHLTTPSTGSGRAGSAEWK